MFRGPISETGYCDPLRGDGESAFARPKDTRIEDSRQDTWPPLSLLGDILPKSHRHVLEVQRTKLLSSYETTDSLQGTSHAVLRTLYSRAHRIVLDGDSCLLHGFRKGVSLYALLLVIACVLA